VDNSEKLATYGKQDEEKQNKNTTQYALDTTIRKQTERRKLYMSPPTNNWREILLTTSFNCLIGLLE